MKRTLLIAVLFLMVLIPARPGMAQAPTDTPTPTPSNTPNGSETPTPTETETPTITPTASSTPNLYAVSTLPSGQAGAIVYTVSIGEAAIFGELAVILALMIFGLFIVARKQ